VYGIISITILLNLGPENAAVQMSLIGLEAIAAHSATKDSKQEMAHTVSLNIPGEYISISDASNV
jgi:hypothetical protein